MKPCFVAFLLCILASHPALADWDPALEAREQAEREAAQRIEQDKQRETQKLLSEAQAKANRDIMDSKRKTLGAAAKGKSDAEVSHLYDAKIKHDIESAHQAAQSARDTLSHGQGAAAVKQITGKSMQELENMSDEEAEALAREMEKKYGN